MADEAHWRIIPLANEEVRVGKRDVVTGRVRVRSVTQTVEQNVGATLEGEQVEVSRIPVGTVVESIPEVRTEGEVTIVPVLEEVLIVEKRLMLKEELHIRRRHTREEVQIPVAVRKQQAIVERSPGDSNPNPTKEKADEL